MWSRDFASLLMSASPSQALAREPTASLQGREFFAFTEVWFVPPFLTFILQCKSHQPNPQPVSSSTEGEGRIWSTHHWADVRSGSMWTGASLPRGIRYPHGANVYAHAMATTFVSSHGSPLCPSTACLMRQSYHCLITHRSRDFTTGDSILLEIYNI
jgi:hypothetical protein